MGSCFHVQQEQFQGDNTYKRITIAHLSEGRLAMAVLKVAFALLLVCVMYACAENVAFGSYGSECLTPCERQGASNNYQCQTSEHHRVECSPDGGITASNGLECLTPCSFFGSSYQNCFTSDGQSQCSTSQ